jgi:hypothetical protein
MLEEEKREYLHKAYEIAKAAAGSGTPGCVADTVLAGIIKTTYKQMVEIAENFSS